MPFRRICREFGEAALTAEEIADTDAPSGLYVMEMVTARALVEGNRETWRMIEPDPTERVRSIQLYGVDPAVMGQATRLLIDGGYADHIDMNFGCPVPKVTRRGGGAALPWKLDLYRSILSAVVGAAGPTPVTVKMRIGIDDAHLTATEAARIAEDVGIAAVGLHARTQEQYYSGAARWDQIAALRETLSIPVFGNGDVFSGPDAVRMMEQTGCDAVVIGRGCQGRPWIFQELVAALHGRPAPEPPDLGEVCQVIIRHADLMHECMGDELRAMREMRKHIGWYLRGFAVGGQVRGALGLVSTVDELRQGLAQLDPSQPFPVAAAGPRGRAGSPKRPHLPQDWLESRQVTEAQRLELHWADDEGGSGG